MSKREITWLIVRAVGLYFAYCALVSVFAVAAAVPDLFSLPKLDSSARPPGLPEDASQMIERGEKLPTEDPAKAEEKRESERLATALQTFLVNVGMTGLYVFGAWYFIRDGRFVYDALSREEPFEREGAHREVTALNLEVEAPPTTVEPAVAAPEADAAPTEPKKPKTRRRKKTDEAPSP